MRVSSLEHPAPHILVQNRPNKISMSETPRHSHNVNERTSPRKPTRLNWSLPDLSVIILGGDGGVVLLFCLGSGGELGALRGGFGGGVASCCCGWLT